MVKSLLAALDGSPASRTAFEAGLNLAAACGARLAGIAVVDEPAIRRPEPIPPGGTAFKLQREHAQLQQARSGAEAILEDAASACRAAGVPFEPRVAAGHPHDAIAAECRRCDLLLLGRETHFGFGSKDKADDTFRRLVDLSPRPIIAFPEAPAPGAGVLIAYDDSIPASRALQLFALLELYPSEPIRILTIRASAARSAETAARAADFLAARGRAAQVLALASEADPGELIRAEIAGLKPRLVVVGAFGHRGLQAKIFGSTTSDLLLGPDPAAPLFISR